MSAKHNTQLVKVDETLSQDFINRTFTQAEKKVNDEFIRILGVDVKPFEKVTVTDKANNQIEVVQLKRSLSKMIKDYAENKFPLTGKETKDDAKKVRKSQTTLKQLLINKAKDGGLGDYMEVVVVSMNYRRVFKGSSKAGEVTLGFQPDAMFNNKSFRDYQNDKRASEARLEAIKVRRDKAQANPERLAQLKAAADEGIIEIEVISELM